MSDLEKFSEFREGLMEAQVIWPGEEEEKGLESPVEEEVAPFGGESRGNWSEEEEDDGLPKLPGAEDWPTLLSPSMPLCPLVILGYCNDQNNINKLLFSNQIKRRFSSIMNNP